MAWLLIHQLIRLLHFCEPSHEGLGIHIISFPVLSYLLESIDWWMVKLMEYGFDSGLDSVLCRSITSLLQLFSGVLLGLDCENV